jgi:hypothetical protein
LTYPYKRGDNMPEITVTNEQEAIEALRATLLYYAPDDSAKAEVDAEIGHNKQYSTSDTQVLGLLVGSLHDGLRFGNWPWTEYIPF